MLTNGAYHLSPLTPPEFEHRFEHFFVGHFAVGKSIVFRSIYGIIHITLWRRTNIEMDSFQTSIKHLVYSW